MQGGDHMEMDSEGKGVWKGNAGRVGLGEQSGGMPRGSQAGTAALPSMPFASLPEGGIAHSEGFL